MREAFLDHIKQEDARLQSASFTLIKGSGTKQSPLAF